MTAHEALHISGDRRVSFTRYKGRALCKETLVMLPNEGKRYVSDGNRLLLAFCKGRTGLQVVGAFSYWKYRSYLCSHGTWVRRAYRREGVGKELWLRALCEEGVVRAVGNTVTDRGFTLLKAVSEQRDDIKVRIDECGERPHRDLRKGRGNGTEG